MLYCEYHICSDLIMSIQFHGNVHDNFDYFHPLVLDYFDPNVGLFIVS